MRNQPDRTVTIKYGSDGYFHVELDGNETQAATIAFALELLAMKVRESNGR